MPVYDTAWNRGRRRPRSVGSLRPQRACPSIRGPAVPAGTLAVNLLGCFLLGAMLELTRQTGWISPTARTIAGVGFLGAFTTFSTFGVETFRAIELEEWHLAGV